ncbi:MAG: beta-galactosidase [Clostridia bacterium]|nr:beta-galactosidase [Clostridia bacterium]
MKKYNPTFPNFPHMLHGGDYNPDQWVKTPEIWDEDMRLMKLVHGNEMTMGIFAWSEIEPEEGVFNFSVFDTMMDKIYENGGRVIFATPSGARPKWLADKYPEVRRVTENLQHEPFRTRHNHCATSPIYREKVRIINEKLAERYGKHPALLGWHLSNEYNGACYCEKCADKFRAWLKEKYGDIETLNTAWWTRFWSHHFNSFDEIEPPSKVGEQSVQGLSLDWKRFVTWNTTDFMKEEIKALRKYSDHPVTTNCMGFFSGLDYHKIGKELDFFSNDNYPNWAEGVKSCAIDLAINLDFCRGVKQGQPFIIMESAPGINIGGMNFCKVKTNEQQLLEAAKMISHGSDSIMYFQWRKGRGACEKFHGAVVDHYGKEDNRVFQNAVKVGEMLEKLDGVVGCGVESRVAFVYSNEQRWALSGENCVAGWEDKNGYYATTRAYYRAFYDKNIPTDIISYEDDFSKYDMLILPTAYILSEEMGKKLKDYVAKGGILVATYMTAVANETDLCYLGGTPGAGLSEMFGLRVDEIDSYAPVDGFGRPMPVTNSVSYGGKEYPLNGIAECIVPKGAKALATYTSNIQAGTGAVYENPYGEGVAYYIGFYQDGEFPAAFISDMIEKYGFEPPAPIICDEGICLRKREGDGENYYFVLNETEETKTVTLDKTYKNMLTGEEMSGMQTLGTCGFLILTDK